MSVLEFPEAADRPQVGADVDDEIDLLELLRTLWLGKWWILAAAILAGALGYAYLEKLAVPEFTAQAVVALENRQSNVVDLQSVMTGLSGDQATINTELEVLRSRRLVGQLVDKLDLQKDPEFNGFLTSDAPAATAELERDATVDSVKKAIAVSNVRSSYVFEITVVTTAAKKSQLLANTLADLFVADQLAVKNEATAQAATWLQERVSSLKTEVETAENKVQEFAAGTTLVSPDALNGLNRQIKDTRTKEAELVAKRDTQAARVSALEAAQSSGDRTSMRDVANDPALNRIVQQGQSDALFDARYSKVLAEARATLSRMDTQLTGLRASLKTLETSFDRQSKDLVSLEQLKREAKASRTLYEYFLSRLKETSVQEGIQQPDSRVLSYAALPTRPSSPRKVRVMALALLLGLVAGSGGILLRESVHTGFRSAEELENETRIPVMGQLPKIRARNRAGTVQYLIEKPTSAAAEAVRNLRTSLLLSHVDKPPKVILSTSGLPGEGKTTNAIALAQNFSGLGRKVLLVEGDIRRRVFDEYFDLDKKHGLLSVVAGEVTLEDAVTRIDSIGCDVILGEKSAINAADVFSSDRFLKFIETLRARYDIVIIDTPPVLLVPDARIIAKSCDAVLFSVLWDKTSRAQVRESIRQFKLAGVRITGFALSQIDAKGMKRYGYGGRYGAYAGYGSKYYDS